MARGLVPLVVLALLASFGPGALGITDPGACQDQNPVNDCFQFATPILTRSVQSLTADDTAAGEEAGEFLPIDLSHTLWWKFTATADMEGSLSVGDSDHQAGVAVYELQQDGSLLLLDAESGWAGWSWAVFDCVAGRTYYVQAGGEEGTTGTIDMDGDVCLPVPPPAPTLTASPGAARGEIALSWASAGNGGGAITVWTVQSAPATCSGFPTLASTAAGATSFTHAGLAEGTAQCYRVAGTNSAGLGAWSTARVTAPLGVPSAARSVAATGGDGTIDLQHLYPTYDGGSALTGFRVYASYVQDGVYAALYETGATTHADAGLGDGATRYYRVHALNGFGESAPVAVSARTWTLPTPARNLAADWDFPYGVEVTWDAPSDHGGPGIDEYIILRGPHGGSLTERDRVSGTTLSFHDAPSALGAWDYAVVAVNAKGVAPRSNVDCGQSIPLPPLSLVPHC